KTLEVACKTNCKRQLQKTLGVACKTKCKRQLQKTLEVACKTKCKSLALLAIGPLGLSNPSRVSYSSFH
ncbi:hypothetical protein CROQUDRAFT_666270, partial [Cronartium quercuum f. sp. fusiforme G11]